MSGPLSMERPPPSQDGFPGREGPIYERFAALVRAFHVLRDAPGVYPWQPDVFDAWAVAHCDDEGSRQAAAFVLHLFARDNWKVGAFDVIDALACWDASHRAVFQVWVMSPWRP